MAKQICITMLTLMFDKSMDWFFPHYILRLQWSHQEYWVRNSSAGHNYHVLWATIKMIV